MSLDLFQSLAWLPPSPADFKQQLKAAEAEGAQTGAILKHLAGHGLNELQLNRLAGVLDRAAAGGRNLDPLTPLRIAVVSNATTEFLEPVLAGTGLRHGFAAEIFSAPYGQVIQELLDPESSIYAFKPDLILVAIDARGLPLQAEIGDAAAAENAVQAALDQIDSLRAAIEANSRAVAIFQSVVRPVDPLFGSLDLAVAGTSRRLTDEFNLRLGQLIADTPHLLLDTAGIAQTVGLASWHDPVFWNLAKVPFSNTLLPLYADHIMRLVAAWRGKSRRGLVLDLDNTVWGGVIGDDGVDGIRIAEGDPVGEAHRDVQELALKLRSRGVVLTVSSKNDDDVARTPFREHHEMLLREDHIAVFQANWQDKATNIQAISNELALGLESFAFLDDNPAERGLVRENLPAVAVPELPDDAALYARTLAASGLFEAVTFSAEDRKRAEDYQSNAMRLKLQASVTDIDAYLRSLEMEITLPSVRRAGPGQDCPADQQVQSVQPDDAPLFRGRPPGDGKRSGPLHDAGSPQRPLCRQRHDQHDHLPQVSQNLGDRHLADELPRAWAKSGASGAASHQRPGTSGGRPNAQGYLCSYRT